jgi:phage terminase large subunit-like protein
MKDPREIADQYVQAVTDGSIKACVYVKQAADRFRADVTDHPDYYYDPLEVNRVIKFIGSLNLTEQARPKKFRLESWQTFIVCNLYGIKQRADHKRKYRNAYIELARKNGKSQLATALSIYHLLMDNDAQVIVSANSKDQAKNVDFKKVKQFSRQLDPKEKHLIPYYTSIKFGDSELIVTASDASKLDGLNASFCLIDELHEAPDNKMYNVLKSSQGSREEPLFVTITTAGFNTESFCYQLRTYCTDILSGMKTDNKQFAIIYTLDADDDFTDEDIWIKANPNLNVSVLADFLRTEVQKAVNNSAERAGVIVKNFNRWLKANTMDIWIDDQIVTDSMQDIKMTDEMFSEMECIVGIDLAAVSDIAAVSYLFNIGGLLYYFNSYYIPEDSVNTSINIQSWREAGANGEINITQGNVCDFDIILADLINVRDNMGINIKGLYYDKFNSTQFIINATENGFKCVPFSQMPGSLNRPLKEFERRIKSGGVVIQRNTITRWMLSNVVLVVNKMGNYSIDKSSRSKKIDGVAAMIDAFGGLLDNPIYNFDVA